MISDDTGAVIVFAVLIICAWEITVWLVGVVLRLLMWTIGGKNND